MCQTSEPSLIMKKISNITRKDFEKFLSSNFQTNFCKDMNLL